MLPLPRRVLLQLVVLSVFSSHPNSFPILAAAGGGKGSKRTGNEGRSGQRCTICQRVAAEAATVWSLAKTTKPGSPYFYIGKEAKGQAAEEQVVEVVSKKICNRNVLSALPNPKGYALHHPTLQWECEDLMEHTSEALVDALTLGENMASFCWEQDVCGSSDAEMFDFVPEDDDDEEEDALKNNKKSKKTNAKKSEL
ncbi:unnamed protein product [Polarella glacialis]|uniref:Uncharacterized protein n=1 Tax=Polarella glacialis TaxID=89957 RepID=A0A813K4F8_POLGL|nr:unnamed protein product [Polarella glacialis]CAE8692296.1 unnamed protein product [Polarella glacialis]